jgi:hypothetical protein
VRDWFAEWRAEPPVYGWATQLLFDKISNAPETAWELVLELIERAPEDEALGLIGAGPLEDLLSEYGGDFIERVEVLARLNDRFRKCLASVWGWSRMPPEVYSRMRRSIDQA